jgi:hypothetical protein
MPDYGPLVAAGLRLEVLRRLFIAAPPLRLLVCVGESDGVLVTDPALLAHLTPSFSAKSGDAALSATANREVWTRPLIAGQPEKVTAWQDGVRTAATAAATHVAERLAEDRIRARAALDARLSAGLEAVRASASAAGIRLGPAHAETRNLQAEAAEEERQVNALRAAVDGATYDLESLTYVMVS